MGDDVPRRLKRFYRKKEEMTQKQNDSPYQQEYSQQDTTEESYDYGFGTYEQSDSQNQGKKELQKIPSMEYEDLEIDEKNAKDIEEYQKKSEDKELALQEIEKFKKENNRMPNKKETEQIAENLYTQIKNNPVDYQDVSTGETRGQERRGHRRDNRQGGKIPGVEEPINPPKETIEDNLSKEMNLEEEPNQNFKNLFSDEEKKTSNKDEFDLGLDDEDEDFSNKELDKFDEEEELREITEDKESQICPNCKKQTEKITYCPKCGFAYCKSCSKIVNGNEAICPKCGTKTKL
jgi:hypothetical protein